ncbi:MAG: response regulator [Candidatus Hydrogenedentes bacterium]|nr:response regulator [Candidatus Hydrogenedentota bacterium]
MEKRLTILVIDDSEADLEILRRHIEAVPGWTADVLAFTDPDAGRAEFAQRVVDVMLLDYYLGGQTGLDVLRAIRAGGDLRPIIMLTGRGDEEIAVETTRAGASDYLVKSKIQPEMLRRAVENAVAQHALRQEKALLEEELRQSQKMETVGQLAGGIAHDFNNLLTGIMGYVELALMRVQAPDVREDLEQVKDICQRMAELIQRLLSFSRRGVLKYETLDINQIVTDIAMVLKHSIPKNVEIRTELPPHELAVRGSAAMLQQVLLNLCVNGAEAMPDGGRLTIRTKRVLVEPMTQALYPMLALGDYAVVEVQDTGAGIDPKDTERIFEPFFTTKMVSSRKGTGLGLAVAWQNVRLHGGMIKVYSERGHGATFRVYVPFASELAGPIASAPRPEVPHGTETILLVDDEHPVRNVIGQLLQQLGYKVYTAADGLEAVDLFRRFHQEIVAVLLDLSMPHMGGSDCFDHLIRIDSHARVIFASGHDMQAGSREFLARGAKDVIQKPYQVSDLATRLRTVIDAPE